MINVSNVWKSFGRRDLFRGAGMQVGARDRLALVGLNGTGKTTLFQMIAGEVEADRGDISLQRGALVGFLRQETDALRGRRLLEEVLAAGSEVTLTAHRLDILEREMAEAVDAHDRDRLVAEYSRLQDRFHALGGYSLEAEAKRILAGLGFGQDDFDRPTESFSGGWLMRIALAKLLLAGPDVLMLDEPTNHLDVVSVEWLERFLRDYEGAILLISHDRDFINGMATKVVEIDDFALKTYSGNYESFVEQRRVAAEQATARAKHQERQRVATERFIDRFRYKNTKARQVQSKIKMLERTERLTPARRPPKSMRFSFPQPPRPGRVVIELSGVRFGYGDALVYESLDFVVERGEKIALVGPNGAGKSTLLKLIAGELNPQAGERRLGHRTHLGYFAQHQIEALTPANRVIEELRSAVPPSVDVDARALLGRFLFSGEDVDKPVSVLSGGERTRVALAKMLVSPVNLICLDEPTNHLDIPSRDVLEDALVDYDGAMVLITHDRHLIRNVADRIVEVRDGSVTVYAGDYDYYLDKREERSDDPVASPARSTDKMTRKDERRLQAEARAKLSKVRDRLAVIERELDEVAAENEKIAAVLADPGAYSERDDISDLVREYGANRRRVELLEEEWEETSLALERTELGSST